jgi:cell division protein FtsQ
MAKKKNLASQRSNKKNLKRMRLQRWKTYGNFFIVCGFFSALLWVGAYTYAHYERIESYGYQTLHKLFFNFFGPLKDVRLHGLHKTPPETLYPLLYHHKKYPTVTHMRLLDLAKDIQRLPWVKNVVIKRSLPSRLDVYIEEKKPIARWKKGNSVTLLADDLSEIPAYAQKDHDALFLLEGYDVPKKAPALLKALCDKGALLASRIHRIELKGSRRWDIHLQSSVIIKCPETHFDKALTTLEMLMKQKKFPINHLKVIDLRSPEKIILEVSDTHAPTLKKS